MKIDFVGGPLDGQKTDPPQASTLVVPITIPGQAGFGTFKYTLRRCKDAAGNVVKVLAPAGRVIDPAYLTRHKLTN